MTTLVRAFTVEDYRAAFLKERAREYPMVDAFEARCGYAVDRARLEAAAEVLACPVKKSPPNWQHGRVLYAAARHYLADPVQKTELVKVLDIGTAKGFSALCLQWALTDAGCFGLVTSVDVIDPLASVPRNSVHDVAGPLTLKETVSPWSEAAQITFLHSTGIDWLTAHPMRLHMAFVDGSHDAAVVQQEGRLIADRQKPGDLAIFDDVDRPDIAGAVASLNQAYRFEVIEVLPKRAYAIGVRR